MTATENRLQSQDWLKSAYRRAAYDFHIPASRKDFLQALDPERTAEVLAEAGVQALQLCAKSHWGLSTYPTNVGVQHPLLEGRDYFGEVVEALNSRGIRCLAYFSDYWDNLAGDRNPGWRQVTRFPGRPQQPVAAKWTAMCPMSPYTEYLHEQVTEVLERYPVTGIFTDMVGFCGFCYCEFCQRAFQEHTNWELPEVEDWSSDQWRAFVGWRYSVTEDKMSQRERIIHALRPDAVFGHNYHGFQYHYYSLSHEPVTAHRSSDYVTIETAPFDVGAGRRYGIHSGLGLQGGSQAAKFARGAARGKPFEAVGARGATGHDFTQKPVAQMLLEAVSIVVNGCPYTVIESADMTGLPNFAAWQQIGRVFGEVKALEPWLLGASPITEVGLVYSRASADALTREGPHRSIEEGNGFYRVCIEEHLQVGYLFDQDLSDLAALQRYKVIVLPDVVVLDDDAAETLRAYVAAGGGLVATHATGLFRRDGTRREDFLTSDLLGVGLRPRGEGGITWMKWTGIGQEVAEDANGQSGAWQEQWLLSRAEPTYVPVEVHGGGVACAHRWASPVPHPEGLNHTSHFEPPWLGTGEPLVVRNHYGSGRTVYLSPRIASTYLVEGQQVARGILREAIRWVANAPSVVSTDAPRSVEVIVNRQDASRRVVVHFVNFSVPAPLPTGVVDFPEGGVPVVGPSWTTYDEPIQLAPIECSLALENPPRAARLVPGCEAVPFTWDKGRIHFTLRDLAVNATVAIDL